jgi:CRP-like cAMP-binding protein
LAAVTPETLSERFPGLASSLSSAGLGRLLDAFVVHDAAAGEALVAEGAWTSDLFLVVEGELDVTQAGRAGGRRLAQLGPGGYFGEVSVLAPGPATATVVTEQGCVVLRLSRSRLDELRRDSPDVSAPVLEEVLRSLLARMRGATTLVEGAAG